MKLNRCNIVGNLNVTFDNGVAISGNLVCNCGCNKFIIYYTGKQTKGILAPYIIPIKDHVYIKAECTFCKKEIVLVNNTDNLQEVKTLELKGIKEFDIICKLNYSPEKLKKDGLYTNDYEELFVYILMNNKEKPIFE